MAGCFGNLHGDRACRRIDPLGLVTIGVALPPGGTLLNAGTEKPLTLDLHRQLKGSLKGSRKDRSDVGRPMFDQMFQEGLNRRVLLPVHSRFSMVVLQLHGIPEWIAPAGPRLSRGSWHLRKNNFLTSSYSTHRPIGKLVDILEPDECANYFTSCGYTPD
jgi:hypothetical protein